MKTTTVTALTATLAAIIVLGVQRRNLVRLDARAADLRSEINLLEQGSSPSASPQREERAPKRIGRSSQTTPPARSATDLTAVRTALVELVASKNLRDPRPRQMIAIYDQILEIVSDCTTDDLMAILEGLEQSNDPQNPTAMLSMILRMLAMEDDPYRFLSPADQADLSLELRAAALTTLARQDPHAARRWIADHQDDVNRRSLEQAYVVIGKRLLHRNVDEAVGFLAELEAPQRKKILGALGSTGLPESESLAAAAHDLTDPQVRRDLLNAAIGSVMSHEGVEAGQEMLAAISDPEDRAFAIVHAAETAMEVRPQETLDWLFASAPDSSEAQAIPEAVAQWTGRDYQAAAHWLEAQAPSANRDQALQSFARTVQRLDPRAAVVWAAEIEDPDLRAATVQSHLNHWKTLDPDAARTWEENRP